MNKKPLEHTQLPQANNNTMGSNEERGMEGEGKKGMSTGMIIGIVVGVIVLIAALGIGGYFLFFAGGGLEIRAKDPQGKLSAKGTDNKYDVKLNFEIPHPKVGEYKCKVSATGEGGKVLFTDALFDLKIAKEDYKAHEQDIKFEAKEEAAVKADLVPKVTAVSCEPKPAAKPA